MSEQTATTTVQETAAVPAAMKLDVSVRPIEPKDNLLAFASVTINDSFVVDGIRLCNGKNGPYLNMPGSTNKRGTWRDACKPITKEFRQQLTEAVVTGYDKAIDKLRDTLEGASRAVAEKPSVRENLKENMEKVAAQPVREAPAVGGDAR